MPATNRRRYPLELERQMLPTDAVFWYAEQATPQLRPFVGALFLLDRQPDREQVRASMERLVYRVPRLRQRVTEHSFQPGLPRWEDDPRFELDYHTRVIALPEPASRRDLLDLAGTLFAAPLDRLRPLWENYLIVGVEGARAACFFKAHHAVMDGIGSFALFNAATQARRNDRVRPLRPLIPPRRPEPPPSWMATLAQDSLWNTASALGSTVGTTARAFLAPRAAVQDLTRSTRAIWGAVRDFRTARPISDPIANRPSSVGRRLDCFDISLSRLYAIRGALGVTLNDVVLAAVAGALGRYHEHHAIHAEKLNCMVPASLREETEHDRLGNRLGVFNVTLPLNKRSPRARLNSIRAQTASAKSDRRGSAYPFVLGVASMLPSVAFRLLVQSLAGKIQLICTNMRGPASRRYLADAKVEVIYPFAPLMLGAPLSIALLSYEDNYAVGIDVDSAAIPDPELLREYLQAALAELEQVAMSSARWKRGACTRPASQPTASSGRRRAGSRSSAGPGTSQAAAAHTK